MTCSTSRATALRYPKSNPCTFQSTDLMISQYLCSLYLQNTSAENKNDPPCIQKFSSAAIFSVSVTGSPTNLFQVPLNSDFRIWDVLAHSRKSEKKKLKQQQQQQVIQVPLATQYNTFFMFKNTAAADSWTEPHSPSSLQLACSVSHKYTTVAVLIKGFIT